MPVLVVPGWFETGRDLAAMRIRLRAAGWPASHVASVTFADPVGGNVEHARELATAVRELMDASGSEQVDIIAHSMGGLATRRFLRDGDDASAVRRVVFLGTPHDGTWSAYLAWGDGRDEMMPGSPFLDSLNALPSVPDGVEALTVRTPIDTHVLPGTSATLAGVPDTVVCCPTHEGLLDDLEVFRVVADFLLAPEGL